MRSRAIWLASLAIAWGAAGHAAEEIADIRQGTNLAIDLSPDGETIAMDLLGRVWLMPVSGGGAEAITSMDHVARNPRFSPSGTQIVYQRLIDDQWDLWSVSRDGATETRLTTTAENEVEPDFTADGSAIVFASNRTGHYSLWQLDVATGVLTQLTEEPGDASFPSVSELGEIVYVLDRGREMSLRTLAGGVVTELVRTAHSLSSPSWRPGGRVVVFREQHGASGAFLKMLLLSSPQVIKPLTNAEDVFLSRAAWLSAAEFLYAADGQIWRRGLADFARRPVHMFAAVAVEAYAAPDDLPVLDDRAKQRVRGISGSARSADGRRTVFAALGDLWLLERGDLKRLTDDAYVDIDPTFAPDGASVIFASDRAGSMSLWRLSLPSGQPVRLTFDAAKAFRPSVAPDGRQLAYLETSGLGPWAPSKLRLLDLGRSATLETLGDDLVDPSVPTWEPGGTVLAVGAATGRGGRALRRYDLRTGRELAATAEPPSTPGEESEPIELEWSVAAPPAEPYVVEVGRLFDGIRGDYRRHVDIHVAGGRIEAIVSRGARPLPAKVVDARDATVIPGMIDIHAHQSKLAGERLGRAWLAYGVTTVRELSDDPVESLERAESWASGRRLGPRLVITPAVTARTFTAPIASIPVREYRGLADGFGHGLWRQSRAAGSGTLRSVRELSPIFARGSGPHHELDFSPLFATYQDGLGRVLSSSTVASSTLGAIVGTGPLRTSGDLAQHAFFDPAELDASNAAPLPSEALAPLRATLARLIRGGGRVAIGTDAPAVPYGLGVHAELRMLVDGGIPNDQALRVATVEGALALGLERELGTLEDGKVADFVVLSGDPLERIEDTLRITAVVKGGTWYDRPQLLSTP